VSARKPGSLGTFLGVFTPTILTILGVILYLRFGWVIGQAGLLGTLAIVVVANAITFATSLSLSAVATNSRVGVGGAYYLISRSLGFELGAAIGLPLFLSQAFSVTLYAFGLAEALRFVWPELPLQPATLAIIGAVSLLALRGAGFALRSQLPVLGLIALSLLALGLGTLQQGDAGRLLEATAAGEHGFWIVFAVFFPAVTGIMAGLGLSGDLREPQRSIPRGTLAAQLAGFAVYLGVPLLLVASVDLETLRSDPLVWTRIAPLGAWLVFPGLWGAIFSSAVGSMLSAPRTLQALAIDRLAPPPLARAAGRQREPVYGLLATLLIAFAAVLLGDLNAVATVVTMFFLTVYGMLNLAAALEELSGDTSWRPTIRAPWPLALLGAFSCFAVMLLIDVTASIVALIVELGIWLAVKRRERRADWGDVRRGIYEALIRWSLLRLARRPMTARSWRPHILVFVEHVDRQLDLVRVGDWFSQDRGLVTACELVVGDLASLEEDPLEREVYVQDCIRQAGLVAFAERNVVASVEQGIVDVAQANGMAGIESNTVLLGWPPEPKGLAVLLRAARKLERVYKSVIVGRIAPIDPEANGRRRSIDVWWGGLQKNGDLLLLLAYLLTRNREWREARIRILSLASNELMKAETERALRALIPLIRIEADLNVIVKPADASVQQVIRTESAEADLVLLGLSSPDAGEEEAYARRLHELAEGLPSFFFVRNNSLFIGDLVSTGAQPQRLPLPADKATSA
jgi:potassium/chloride transporter 4/5/6